MLYILDDIEFTIELRYKKQKDKSYCSNVLHIYTTLPYGENVEYKTGVTESKVEEVSAALANGTFTLNFEHNHFLILFKYGDKSLPLENNILVSDSLEESFRKHREYLKMEKELNELRAQLGKPAAKHKVSGNYQRIHMSID